MLTIKVIRPPRLRFLQNLMYNPPAIFVSLTNTLITRHFVEVTLDK
jgi:hypothetical protein